MTSFEFVFFFQSVFSSFFSLFHVRCIPVILSLFFFPLSCMLSFLVHDPAMPTCVCSMFIPYIPRSVSFRPALSCHVSCTTLSA